MVQKEKKTCSYSTCPDLSPIENVQRRRSGIKKMSPANLKVFEHKAMEGQAAKMKEEIFSSLYHWLLRLCNQTLVKGASLNIFLNRNLKLLDSMGRNTFDQHLRWKI